MSKKMPFLIASSDASPGDDLRIPALHADVGSRPGQQGKETVSPERGITADLEKLLVTIQVAQARPAGAGCSPDILEHMLQLFLEYPQLRNCISAPLARKSPAGPSPFYFKNRVMAPGDNPPVGIILCSDRRQTKVEFATAGMDNRLFVSRYLVALPKPEQLEALIEADRAQFECATRGAQASRQGKSRRRSRASRRGGKP